MSDQGEATGSPSAEIVTPASEYVFYDLSKLETAIAQRDALIAALNKIATGSFPGSSDLAISGGWQPFVDKLQAIAAEAIEANL